MRKKDEVDINKTSRSNVLFSLSLKLKMSYFDMNQSTWSI